MLQGYWIEQVASLCQLKQACIHLSFSKQCKPHGGWHVAIASGYPRAAASQLELFAKSGLLTLGLLGHLKLKTPSSRSSFSNVTTLRTGFG